MKWRNQINKWSLKRKISFFLSLTITMTSIMILVISTMSAAYYMIRQSKEMMEEQLNTLSSNYADTLKQYQNLAVSVILNDGVQKYSKSTVNAGTVYEQMAGEAYNCLQNMLNVQRNMNFAVVIKEHPGSYVYKGNSSIADTRFTAAYQEDFEESIPIKEGSTVRISFSSHYFRDGSYTLTMYHPIYDTSAIREPKGMLVMNFSDSMLEQLHIRNAQNIDSEMFLIDYAGWILSTPDTKKIGTQISYRECMRQKSGSFQERGRLINYQEIDSWNFYLINEIPMWELYKGSFGSMAILLVAVFFVTAGALIVLRKTMDSFYEPMSRVVGAMDGVAEGQLDLRIDIKSMDTDSRKLAKGFNLMMDRLDLLMEQVKMEQHQMEQIRFNALQSQIQPHFLYNTLECIHWQAVVDGNREISTMVKAMAQYYRICLSRGREIIALKEELEHIRSYLIIQNMRYDNIIELAEQIPEEYMKVKIPKMTLQPLIENAIYHGIRVKEGEKGTIELGITKNGEDVHLLVSDNGTGMSEEKIREMNSSISSCDENFGYGVRNVNRRIELMFGKKYGIRFALNDCGGVVVDIYLPFEAKEGNREVI